MIIANQISDQEIETLLEEILDYYGYDFTEYARASIKRRILRIFTLEKFETFLQLRNKVINDRKFFKRFVEEITVNVTEMFRDPKFYKCLRSDILPKLAAYPFIRIWLAGCSTGEEAYSIAILLKELGLLEKSLIYATDLNPIVLEKAESGIFSLSQMKTYSKNYIESGGIKDFSSYYTATYDLVKFNRDLRKKMIFSTHNLVSDRSFNEFQLILCRNVFIYFDRDLQHKVLQLFDASLEKNCFLALGTKETIDFSSIARKYERIQNQKIWRKLQ